METRGVGAMASGDAAANKDESVDTAVSAIDAADQRRTCSCNSVAEVRA